MPTTEATRIVIITRLYSVPCSSPGGIRHHKQTLPTTDDQPSYPPKPMEAINQACPLGSKRSYPITYPFENVVLKSNLIPMVLCN